MTYLYSGGVPGVRKSRILELFVSRKIASQTEPTVGNDILGVAWHSVRNHNHEEVRDSLRQWSVNVKA
jgi:hypothetical protein